jgi:hypothetical protein
MKSKITSELAEFIGILLGDGSLSIYNSGLRPYYRLKISFHSEDLDYIAFVSELIQYLFDEKPIFKKRKNENTADLFVFKRNIINHLLDLGLKKSPKWNRAIIPKLFLNRDLGRFVLRGYFDTDGSLVVANNNGTIYPRLEMKISPSPMQDQFIQLLKIYGFNFGVYQIGKGKVRIQMNGKTELQKWIKLIGFNNIKHLNKYQKFK